MATAFGAEDDIHRALCVRHPNCKQLHFCYDCIRVFCADCRSLQIERVNHLSHRTAPLQEVLEQRRERMVIIRKFINDYIRKHDITLNEILMLDTEQKEQLNNLNDTIDEFITQLHLEVENMKTETKQIIARRAGEIWKANRESSRLEEINKELNKLRDIRAAIDHEMRLCDRDELYLVEKNKDLESLAIELSDFQQKTFNIPDKSCYNLQELNRK